MPEVINLNKARKQRRSADEKKQASANRERFGRTKQERKHEEAEQQRSKDDLDGKKLD